MKRKSIGIKIGCFLLCILILVSSTPIIGATHTTEKTMEKQVVKADGKPDLIIISMGFAPYGDPGIEYISYATVKNIGDAPANGIIYGEYTFTRMFFGMIPIKVVRTGTNWVVRDGGLQPQDYIFIDFIYESELPKFGFFQFKCTVNPGRTIEESNYSNNALTQKYIAVFGHWIQIG